MNKDYVLWNLREAAEELTRTMQELHTDKHGEPEFALAMAHVYHQLNTAWNARNASAAQAAECSEENFNRWRQFPADDEILL